MANCNALNASWASHSWRNGEWTSNSPGLRVVRVYTIEKLVSEPKRKCHSRRPIVLDAATEPPRIESNVDEC